MNSRQQAIIEEFINADNEPLTSAQLSAVFNVSPKTIRNNIKELNPLLQRYDIQIYSVRGKGYLLKPNDKKILNRFLQEYDKNQHSIIPAEPEGRIHFLMEKLLFCSDYIKMEDLAAELFISRSTLQSDLKTVRSILSDYELTIYHKPNYGIKVRGKEILIRFCISEYIFNQEPLPLETNWMKIVSEEDLEVIRESILSNLRKYQIIISDISLQNLLTHLAIAYKRICEDKSVHIPSKEIPQAKEGKEFLVAHEIMKDIEKGLGVRFPENEITYLSIHLRGTKLMSSINESNDVQVLDSETDVLAKEIVKRIDTKYALKLSDDKEFLQNLSLHLKPAINRYRHQMNIRNPMLEEIKMKYPLSFEAALMSADVLYEQLDIHVNEDEIGYIALHIETAQEKLKRSTSQRKRCLIVCSSGLGSAQLLLYKLKNKFSDKLEIVGTTEYYTLNNQAQEGIDFIISTIPIDREMPVPIIYVSTILGDSDISEIEQVLGDSATTLEKTIIPDYTFLNCDFVTPEAVIQFLTEVIIKDKKAGGGYTKSVLEREDYAPTSFGNLVALPHPLEPGTNATFLSIVTLRNPIQWGDKHVQLVILLNVDKTKSDDLKPMFNSLVRLIDNKQAVFQLLECETFTQLKDVIKSVERH
ncbi:MAG TPA: BglG family transcription antiterminator [Lentibacillus sp.]|uniref:BglG family transcription antiterminator n=1 Tax=Lentibacillus sp. TaxID=1925746 RepID=UPI002B4B4422|nr:BglG family transcription antiterminator [Lentibacillus sp.]HLR63642.1 BglG family transcription antiterminator [Lentibacillus sp.]